MTFKPISGFDRWIQGTAPLPAGAVPLAAETFGIICLMPNGKWIHWLGGVIASRPAYTQQEVLDVVISQLGGTAAATADKLGVSARTVEAWRSGKAPLPIKAAYLIAKAMAVAK